MSKNPKERPPFNDIIRYLVHLSSQEVSQGVFPRCSKPVQQTAKAVQVIKVEAADHTCCGADLAWLSMYADEREVLFPPLTYLEYVSHEQLRPGRTVITARPSFS